MATWEAGNIAAEPEYDSCGAFICLGFVPRVDFLLVDGIEPGTLNNYQLPTDPAGKRR